MLKGAVLAIVLLLLGGLVAQGVEELAELHVMMLTLDPPSAITRGLEVEVHARLMNTGQRAAESFSVGFFYRPADGAGSWQLVSTIDDAALAPSQEDSLEVVFTLPTLDLELGVYEVRVVADPLNQIPEVDEFNNELQTSFTLIASSIGRPDLQPSSLSYEPTNPESNDDMLPWNISAAIQNPSATASGPFSIVFLVDDVEFDRKFLFALPAGGSTDIVGELDPFLMELAAGTHNVSVLVDPDDQVLEQDEENNSITGALTLLSTDLFPTAVSFDKTVVRQDEEVRVTATIGNDGKGSAKNVAVAFYIDHIRFGLVTIPLLGQGLSVNVEAILSPAQLGVTDTATPHEVLIIVDPNDVLPELDEANNEMVRTLSILPPGERKPELHPESIELNPPSPVELGRSDTVAVSTVIRNTGRADAVNFNVSFSYRVKGGRRWENFPCSGDASCSSMTLAAGMQTKLVGLLPVVLLPPGVYEFRVLVDTDSTVAELDEYNNEMTTSMTLLAAQLPDLSFCYDRATVVEPSTQVQIGQTVRMTPCVTNVGDLDAGPFVVRFSYQKMVQDGTVQPTEFRTSHFSPASEIQVRELAIGDSAEIPVLLETRDLEPGQYLVQMEIDPATSESTAGAVNERNEQNNVSSLQITILGPDLSVINMVSDPELTVARGEPLELTTTIINSGVTPAGSFTVAYKLFTATDALEPIRVWSCDAEAAECMGPEYFASVRLPGLDLLEPEAIQCPLDTTAIEAGEYIVQVEVDVEDAVAEHNELNNFAQLFITVTGDEPVGGNEGNPLAGTDLVIQSFHAIQMAGVQSGFSQLWVTVVNQGENDLGAFYVQFSYTAADGTEVELTPPQRVPLLLAGATATVLQRADTSALTKGYYTTHVRVDVRNDIAETNETNNTRDEDLYIR